MTARRRAGGDTAGDATRGGEVAALVAWSLCAAHGPPLPRVNACVEGSEGRGALRGPRRGGAAAVSGGRSRRAYATRQPGLLRVSHRNERAGAPRRGRPLPTGGLV